jgi:hypothetical protein
MLDDKVSIDRRWYVCNSSYSNTRNLEEVSDVFEDRSSRYHMKIRALRIRGIHSTE